MDLLTDDFESVDINSSDNNKDNLTLLNEILNAPPDKDDFSQEWNAVFGTPVTPQKSSSSTFGGGGGTDSGLLMMSLSSSSLSAAGGGGGGGMSQFMPSCLLDLNTS